METTVTTVRRDPDAKRATAVVARAADGSTVEHAADEVISTMPFSHLLKAMDPPPPAEVVAAADQLRFWDFLTIALVVPVEYGFPDNWIYIHAPEVQVGRIQNFGQWSPYLVKDGRTCLGLEYFVFEGEGLWSKPDDELVALGTQELAALGLVDPSRVETGYGYIVPGAALGAGTFEVARFTEKPDAQVASDLLAQGALWNSGLFAWPATMLRQQVSRFTPEIAPHLAHLDAGDVQGFFDAVTPISIDVGLLERSDAVAVLPGRFSWDDIGTWEALARVRAMDEDGNVPAGPVSLVDAERCIIWSDGTPIVASGVKDLVIVAANGRILVMDRGRASHLKDTLDQVPPDIRELPQ